MEQRRPARRIALNGVFNCRDLGGYPCANGKVTQYGRFLRCGIPFGPMGEDLRALKDFPVGTVIDLRGDSERKGFPSAFADGASAAYHPCTLLEVNPAAPTDADLPLWEVYRSSMEAKRATLVEIFRIMARAPEGAILFHCTLGKDRTGIVASLLLRAAGVAMEDVLADYQVSSTYLARFYEMLAREFAEDGALDGHRIQKEQLRSDPENMAKLYAWLEEAYGGARGYLTGGGLREDDLCRVIARLTD